VGQMRVRCCRMVSDDVRSALRADTTIMKETGRVNGGWVRYASDWSCQQRRVGRPAREIMKEMKRMGCRMGVRWGVR